MTTTTDNRRTVSERLASAANSSDLSVQIDKRGDADYLIAAGATPARLGRYVFQLMSEWDSCAKPRPATAADIEHLAAELPRLKATKRTKRGTQIVERLDLVSAQNRYAEWLEKERHQVFVRLKSLQPLMDPHAGFLPWVVARGYQNPARKLLDVLGWWADRRCSACEGTKEREGRPCKKCRGTGERPIPHGQDGQTISEHIAAHVDRARVGTRNGLKGMRNLKAFAAGEIVC